MANLLPESLLTLRLVPGATWRRIPLASWQRRNLRRCMICHPNPVPPFPDCPHGHYLNPWRIEQKARYEWRSDFVWYTGFGLLTSVFLAGGLVIWLFGFAMWLFFFTFFVINHLLMRGMAKQCYRAGMYYDDPDSFFWEKNSRRNQPWIKRYYP